jgi:hypothetical protein
LLAAAVSAIALPGAEDVVSLEDGAGASSTLFTLSELFEPLRVAELVFDLAADATRTPEDFDLVGLDSEPAALPAASLATLLEVVAVGATGDWAVGGTPGGAVKEVAVGSVGVCAAAP